jgi:hypothetical protein
MYPLLATLQVFMTVKIQVEVFWVMTLHTNMIRYQHVRRPCCLYLQGEVDGNGKGA